MPLGLAILAICFATSASAQYAEMKLGEQFEESLFFRICPTLAAAQRQSENARYQATRPLDDVHLKDLLVQGCIEGAAFLTPLHEETSIPGGRGWNSVFDPEGEYTCVRRLGSTPVQDGKEVRIPCNWVIEEFRFYAVKFVADDGSTFGAYAELFATSITFQYKAYLGTQGASP